ncbi:hydroxymethylglutaryl-CoA lyase [Cladophialophora yegresii CBS 114405]|uniref:hydroxymethylglutaryl-CoA lyase n=1 Tax=Cladophialophora yegresii CBS 114405 TaxID=1182544 RepID=W9WLE5_9EURO|nr:hydroxymethylglutaryl-CoA lyase [Cladophialophora yegresii CBS 114405]EXJ65411.1 hydroxymethylglutaryl-CoA lyase [Cladophialophora yegresii CBS 114405]
MSEPPGAARIVEVRPRDGLQNIKTTGLQTMEITSVVSPRAIPQLADCRAVLADPMIKGMVRDDSLRVPVLVTNLKGLEVAVENGVREVAVFVSATEAFSRANINATIEEGLARAGHVANRATVVGVAVRGSSALLDMGCYEVSLGDTLGVGTAVDVKTLLDYLLEHGISSSQYAGHFHDTYDQVLGNVWQAYRCGLRVFDSSVAGL